MFESLPFKWSPNLEYKSELEPIYWYILSVINVSPSTLSLFLKNVVSEVKIKP